MKNSLEFFFHNLWISYINQLQSFDNSYYISMQLEALDTSYKEEYRWYTSDHYMKRSLNQQISIINY